MLVGLAIAVGIAQPAAAHSADVPVASDYRSAVTGISPPLPGLTVRSIEAGARLELVNHTGRTIEVLGYSGEPYLQIAPDGVYQNADSPATYINETLLGGVAPPPSAGAAMAPDWRWLSGTPAVVWHDQRVHWVQPQPPADVAADPTEPHHVRDWSVPLRDGVRLFAVTGTLDWVPPPSPATWWAGCLLGAAAVAGVGLLAGRRGMGTLAVVALAGGVAGLGYAVGTAMDTGALGGTGVLRALLVQQLWPVVCSVAALVAGGYALLARPAADLAVGLAGACLALFAGVPNAAVFAHAVVPMPGPGTLARVLVLLMVAGGVGLAGAAGLRMRGAVPTPARAAPQPQAAEKAAQN
ncbi:MAG: hypothetical protein J2P15_20155 [Micromonosporaceae bacterium]|nr:hypothetical protein [Micromonosporaceae bacterium]